MKTDKPLIAILMAVYEPRLDWLQEQLRSLEQQTYPNLRLYLRDDCSPTVSIQEIQSCVQACILSFPYELYRNEMNLGSNKTFELLTQEADGGYFAYCDQDDIWLPEKLNVLQTKIEEMNAALACSDMQIIDGAGHKTAESISQIRRHHIFYNGENCTRELLTKNFVTGCTMLVRSEIAKRCVPFCPYMVHDHYIALCCAEWGSIYSYPHPLIQYRIHGGNQTGMLTGVIDKKSYQIYRIDRPLARLTWLEHYFLCGEQTRKLIHDTKAWMLARQTYWSKGTGTLALLKYYYCGPQVTFGELILRYLPDQLFMKIIVFIRENRL